MEEYIKKRERDGSSVEAKKAMKGHVRQRIDGEVRKAKQTGERMRGMKTNNEGQRGTGS